MFLKIIGGLVLSGSFALFVWWITPPQNVIGSVLPEWRSTYRKMKMIRDGSDQAFDLGDN